MIAMLVTAVTSWAVYDRVRAAVEREFERGLQSMATTVASQVDPEAIEDVAEAGEFGSAYLALYEQLSTLRSATGIENAAVIDSARITLVEGALGMGVEGLPTALDSLAGPALGSALDGVPAVSQVYRVGGRRLRASFAPIVGASGIPAGVVAIEAEPAYVPILAGLGRTLVVIAVVSSVVIGLVALLLIRAAWSAGRMERRLSRLENLAAMGRLTATLAHEIKNPLAIIRGSAERLKKLEPDAQRMAEFVIEETDRLSRTVARYLQFARGGDEIRESGDAGAALETTLDLLEGEFAARRVTVERSGPSGPAPVALDEESLKQVYLNLLLNALEAMPEGGRIRVARSQHRGRVEVSIADQGAGIPPDVLKRMGSPFYTTKAKGSGLGLFLTRRLVQASGGDLQIQSRAGQGTTCTVRFPRWRD